MTKIIVIGAGASGLMAAIAAGRMGASVTILEKTEKPGKKLLMTGNGRCNLTNTAKAEPEAFRGEDPDFASAVLKCFGTEDTLDFFLSLGVCTRERGGYIYPYTDQASTVLEGLFLEIQRLGITLKCRERANAVIPDNGGYRVCTDSWQYSCDKVILACGSKAAWASGTEGDGYRIAKALGHSVIPVLPALVPLKIKEPLPGIVSGTRSQAKVTLLIDGIAGKSEEGELQWTSYGISGIVVFQISRFAVRALSAGKQVQVLLDLLPHWSEEELLNKSDDLSAQAFLNGLFPKKLQNALIRHCFGKKAVSLNRDTLSVLLHVSKNLLLHVQGSKDFESAQVCSGGISVKEIFPSTLESRLHPGFYLTGEVLDIDGMCGGYNLQWAWSTGYLAGTSAAGNKILQKSYSQREESRKA